MNQLEIDFQPGLTEQFPRWMDCVRDSVYGCGKALKVVASDIDMTSTELSRKRETETEQALRIERERRIKAEERVRYFEEVMTGRRAA